MTVSVSIRGLQASQPTFDEVQELFVRAAYIDRKMKTPNLAPVHEAPLHPHNDASRIKGADAALSSGEMALRRAAEALGAHVTDESQKRCLLHWASAKAGGTPFVVFCRISRITVETGIRKKNAAIGKILESFRLAARG